VLLFRGERKLQGADRRLGVVGFGGRGSHP
jgi:hypothetical protein